MTSDVSSFRFLDTQVGQRVLAYNFFEIQALQCLVDNTYRTNCERTCLQKGSRSLLTEHPLG